MKILLRLLPLSLFALSLGSCTAYRVQTNSWWLRYHPEENEAYYIEIQDGVTADASAAESLRLLVGGWRQYPPEGGLLALDLDEVIDWSEVKPPMDVEELKRIFMGLQREIVVTETGVFRAGDEGLGFFRVTHIKDLSLLLEGVNIFINAILADQWEGEDDLKWEYFTIGEETKARWMERVTKGEPWLSLQDSAFVLEIPMTEREAAGFLRAVLEDAEDFPPGSWFLLALDKIQIADGSLSLNFAPEGLRFHSQETNDPYSLNSKQAELLEALGTDPGFKVLDRSALLERVK